MGSRDPAQACRGCRWAKIDRQIQDRSKLQRYFNSVLFQQRILPLLKFLGLFGQAIGTPQLTLADLLNVNFVGSLNGSPQYQHHERESKGGHPRQPGGECADQPKSRPRTDPGTLLPLQTLGLRGRRLEGPSKAQQTSELASTHLELSPRTSHKPSQFRSPSWRPSPGACRFAEQRSEPKAWPPRYLPLTWQYQRQRCLKLGEIRAAKS